jgi:hypothetical protein
MVHWQAAGTEVSLILDVVLNRAGAVPEPVVSNDYNVEARRHEVLSTIVCYGQQ